MTHPDDCAYPLVTRSTGEPGVNAVTHLHAGGMTKREQFAAMAMQGFIAAGTHFRNETVSELAVAAADHLIAELNK